MSLTKFEFIEPQEFIDLKNQVKNEVKRRSYTDLDKLYNKYGVDTYNFNIIPAQNLSITYEDIHTILAPLETINKDILGVNISKHDSISIDDFQSIKNALNIFSTSQKRTNNTCSTNCVGMCISTCYDVCTGCTGCTSCQGCSGCTSCEGSCYHTCWSACGGCSGTCTGGCLPSCYVSGGGFTGG